MIKYNKIIALVICIILASCEDEDKAPFQQDEFAKGAVITTVEEVNLEVDINAIAASVIQVDVEINDFQGNDNFESVDVFVSFVDTFVDEEGILTPDNANDDLDISKEDVFVRNLPASVFVPSEETGKLATTIEVTASEAIELLGLSSEIGLMDGGDIFRVRLALKAVDGTVFTSTNVNSNVVSGRSFLSPFSYDANVVCGFPEDFLVGTYAVELIEGEGPFGPFIEDGVEVEVTASSGTARSFNYTYLPDIGGFGGTFNFNLICGNIIVPNQPSGSGGLNCGGSEDLEFETESVILSGDFDDVTLDDTSFTIIFNDFITDSGCGSAYSINLKLTKI